MAWARIEVAMAASPAPTRTPVPGPSTWLPGGAYWEFRKDAPTFFTKTARNYGDIAGFKFGPQKVYLVSKPEWIEDILVKSAGKFGKGIALERAKGLLGEGLLTASGQHHLKQRRTIQPLFHRQHVQGFAEAMVRHAARWRESVTPGAQLDITTEMSRLTLAIVGDTLFSSDVKGDADEVREALTDAISTFTYAFVPGLGLLSRLPIPVFQKMRAARERLDRVIHRVIAERRAGNPEGLPPQKLDLVSMLLAARDPENPDEGGMSDKQIRDEAMTIFLAGHETTANAMAWTWHLLGSAPEAEARLHEELDRALGGRIPTMEDVPQLEWARAIVAESMRLYPPAWIIGRRALEEHTLGGHTIEKRALVVMSQWVVHRDPRWWNEPEIFAPTRWITTPDSRLPTPDARPKYAYFPFGGGTRVCIGESFAWTEAILLLATIAQRWRFVAGPNSTVTPEARITMRPRGLTMTAVERSG
jgi:cytochrome P450